MEAIVKQPLGHIKRSDAGRCIGKAVKHEFVLAEPVDRQSVTVFQGFLHIIGVQDRKRACHTDVFLA